jgi:hypothetical protein
MFKVAQKRRVTWPVTVRVPQDGGRTLNATFSAEFDVLTTDEQQDAIQDGKDLLDVQLVGWDGRVKGEDGEPLPFSPEAKKQVLAITYVRQALFEALGEINSGRAAARKN